MILQYRNFNSTPTMVTAPTICVGVGHVSHAFWSIENVPTTSMCSYTLCRIRRNESRLEMSESTLHLHCAPTLCVGAGDKES